MSRMLVNAKLFTRDGVIEQAGLVISDHGHVTYAGPSERMPQRAGACHDLEGRIIAPGFVDIHVHGGMGVRFDDIDELDDGLRKYSRWVAGTGVVGFLCSVCTPDADSLIRTVEAYVDVLSTADMPGAIPLGLHLEGPFVSPDRTGALNPSWLRNPSRYC